MAGIFNAVATKRDPLPGAPQETKPESESHFKNLRMSPVESAGSTWVYINLTNVHGQCELRLRYVSLEDHKVLFESNPFSVNATTPLVTLERALPFPKLPSVPGDFAVELHCDDEILGACRVTVGHVD